MFRFRGFQTGRRKDQSEHPGGPPDTALRAGPDGRDQLYLHGLQARLSGCSNRSQAMKKDAKF